MEENSNKSEEDRAVQIGEGKQELNTIRKFNVKKNAHDFLCKRNKRQVHDQ